MTFVNIIVYVNEISYGMLTTSFYVQTASELVTLYGRFYFATLIYLCLPHSHAHTRIYSCLRAGSFLRRKIRPPKYRIANLLLLAPGQFNATKYHCSYSSYSSIHVGASLAFSLILLAPYTFSESFCSHLMSLEFCGSFSPQQITSKMSFSEDVAGCSYTIGAKR